MIGRGGGDREREEVDGDVGGGEQCKDAEGEGSRIPHGNFPDVARRVWVYAGIRAVDEGLDQITD